MGQLRNKLAAYVVMLSLGIAPSPAVSADVPPTDLDRDVSFAHGNGATLHIRPKDCHFENRYDLYLAIKSDTQNIISCMERKYIDLTQKDQNGQTFLDWANRNGYGDLTKLLPTNEAFIKQEDQNERAHLRSSNSYGGKDAARRLSDNSKALGVFFLSFSICMFCFFLATGFYCVWSCLRTRAPARGQGVRRDLVAVRPVAQEVNFLQPVITTAVVFGILPLAMVEEVIPVPMATVVVPDF